MSWVAAALLAGGIFAAGCMASTAYWTATCGAEAVREILDAQHWTDHEVARRRAGQEAG